VSVLSVELGRQQSAESLEVLVNLGMVDLGVGLTTSATQNDLQHAQFDDQQQEPAEFADAVGSSAHQYLDDDDDDDDSDDDEDIDVDPADAFEPDSDGLDDNVGDAPQDLREALADISNCPKKSSVT
jgi:hypothetical protein